MANKIVQIKKAFPLGEGVPKGRMRLYLLSPRMSSAETSSISQRFAKVSIDGNLSQCKYLLIVEGFTPSCTASSFFEILLVKIASLKFFCISVIVIIENY